MDEDLKNRLLRSISDDRLVVICGAGLSMAPPSSLPSAVSVANTCHDKERIIDNRFDMSIRDDIEAIAHNFYQRGELVNHFISTLVPWKEFRCDPNDGHKALSDFLMCKAVKAVLSTNYDELIEEPAKKNGADLQIALDGTKANLHQTNHSPLIKIHGCASKCREETIWIDSQIHDVASISARVQNISNWMNVNLIEKDLLIIGFWTDWAYLNTVLQSVFENVTTNSITVIDLSDSELLRSKAPVLWNMFNSGNVKFSHVRESGSEFLNELRKEYSKMYLRKMFSNGINEIESEYNIKCDNGWFDIPNMESEEYYQWRRDSEGIGYKYPPKEKLPVQNNILGHMHLLLLKEGAVMRGAGYEINGEIVKLINGFGRYVDQVRELYIQPPSASEVHVHICVSSDDRVLPTNIVSSSEENSIIRNSSVSLFMNHKDAREKMGI